MTQHRALPPLSTTVDDEISVRGRDLARELIGRRTFTELFLLDLDGRAPDPDRVAMVDAVLCSLMEHGLTPSTLAARLVEEGAPDAMQGAVAAGLLAVGSRFLGTIEDVARVVQRVAAHPRGIDVGAREAVADIVTAGGRVPGVGHTLHHDLDPRVAALSAVAAQTGFAGAHLEALHAVAREACERSGRKLIVNAAGAVGAILSDLGYPPDQVRGFALVARCAGLVAHVVDEMRAPYARSLWVEAHKRASAS